MSLLELCQNRARRSEYVSKGGPTEKVAGSIRALPKWGGGGSAGWAKSPSFPKIIFDGTPYSLYFLDALVSLRPILDSLYIIGRIGIAG